MRIRKTQRRSVVNNEELIVGIDVTKMKHFARILFPDGSESAPFGFLNVELVTPCSFRSPIKHWKGI